jgi:HAD superfamily phosphoserine phosphatase-like hydrolase
MIKAVVFDLDGTLAPGVSWLELTRGLGADVAVHQRIFDDYTSGTITYEQSKDQLLGLWRATGHANAAFMRRLFASWPLHQAARPIIKLTRDQGLRPCLITGSVDLYAEVMAGRLGIFDWFANTRLSFDTAGNLTDYDYHRDQAAEKLSKLEYFCIKYRLKPAECLAVGDSDNDVQLFRATQHGLLLEAESQTPELHDAAWQIIERLADLKHVLQALDK